MIYKNREILAIADVPECWDFKMNGEVITMTARLREADNVYPDDIVEFSVETDSDIQYFQSITEAQEYIDEISKGAA